MSGCENDSLHNDYCNKCFTCHDCLSESAEGSICSYDIKKIIDYYEGINLDNFETEQFCREIISDLRKLIVK